MVGVKTYVWGPFGWDVIHGLGRAGREAQTRRLPKVVRLVHLLLFLLQFLLPCRHCRKSYGGFLSVELKSVVDLFELTYLAHELVNKKLDFQRHKGISDREARQPTVAEAYEVALPLDSEKFMTSLLWFLNFTIRDMDEERIVYLKQFMDGMSELLQETQYGEWYRRHVRFGQDIASLVPGHGAKYVNEVCDAAMVDCSVKTESAW